MLIVILYGILTFVALTQINMCRRCMKYIFWFKFQNHKFVWFDYKVSTDFQVKKLIVWWVYWMNQFEVEVEIEVEQGGTEHVHNFFLSRFSFLFLFLRTSCDSTCPCFCLIDVRIFGQREKCTLIFSNSWTMSTKFVFPKIKY